MGVVPTLPLSVDFFGLPIPKRGDEGEGEVEGEGEGVGYFAILPMARTYQRIVKGE